MYSRAPIASIPSVSDQRNTCPSTRLFWVPGAYPVAPKNALGEIESSVPAAGAGTEAVRLCG